MNARTPSEIRDAAIERFDSVAAPKFDAGQKEHGGKSSLLAEENEALRRECGKLRASLEGED